MHTIKLFNYLIDCAPELLGIRFWALHYSQNLGFEIYEYLGKDRNSDLHFFSARRDGRIYMRRLEELGKHGFKPFLLNFEKINAAVGSEA